MNLMEKWKKFFSDAGVPSSEASTYAYKFAHNRIQTNMLTELNKDYLKEMGITIMGDVIAILRHSKQFYEELQKNEKTGLPEDIKEVPKKKEPKLPSKKVLEEPISKSASSNVPQKRKSEVVEKPSKKIATEVTKKSKSDSSLMFLNNDTIEECEDIGYVMIDSSKKKPVLLNQKITAVPVKLAKPKPAIKQEEKPAQQTKSDLFFVSEDDDDDDDDNVEVIINDPIVTKFNGFNRFQTQEKYDKFPKYKDHAKSATTQIVDQNKRTVFKRLGEDVSLHSVTSTTAFEDEEHAEKRSKDDVKNSVFYRLGQKCDVSSTVVDTADRYVNEEHKLEISKNSVDKTDKTVGNRKVKISENCSQPVIRFRPTYTEGILGNSKNELKLTLKDRLGSSRKSDSITEKTPEEDAEILAEYRQLRKSFPTEDYYKSSREVVPTARKRVSFGTVSEKLIPSREEAIRNGELELAAERVSVFDRLGFDRNY